MANELTLSVKANLVNDLLTESFEVRSLQVDQTNQGSWSSVVDVGTSVEDLAYTDITTEGYCFIRNLDDTNFVSFGPTYSGSYSDFGRLQPGEVAIFRLEPNITFSIVADTAPVKCKVIILED